jgi:hypothetical protein
MDRTSASRARQRIRKIEEARAAHVETLLSADEMIAGSFVVLVRKCGKPTCRCATGDGHEARCLSRSEGGKTRMKYVPARDEVEVAAKSERYRTFRQARAELMRLSGELAELADELQAALTEPSPRSEAAGRAQGRSRRRREELKGE